MLLNRITLNIIDIYKKETLTRSLRKIMQTASCSLGLPYGNIVNTKILQFVDYKFKLSHNIQILDLCPRATFDEGGKA